MFERNGRNVRQCVDCGFSDELSSQPVLVGEAPVTRVSHEEGDTEDKRNSADVQVVRILDKNLSEDGLN